MSDLPGWKYCNRCGVFLPLNHQVTMQCDGGSPTTLQRTFLYQENTVTGDIISRLRARIAELEEERRVDDARLAAANGRVEGAKMVISQLELELSPARVAENAKLKALLVDYEKWEGALIMDGDWQDEFPKLTQELYDDMMKLQARRNDLLGRFKVGEIAVTTTTGLETLLETWLELALAEHDDHFGVNLGDDQHWSKEARAFLEANATQLSEMRDICGGEVGEITRTPEEQAALERAVSDILAKPPKLPSELVDDRPRDPSTGDPYPVRSPWQSIATVPKDRLVDLWWEGLRFCDCYYDQICDEWRTSRPGNRLFCGIKKPTHWMEPPGSPLPAVAAIEAARERGDG